MNITKIGNTLRDQIHIFSEKLSPRFSKPTSNPGKNPGKIPLDISNYYYYYFLK